MWETEYMLKPNLRIVRHIGNAPSLGVCESCNAQFFAPAYALGDMEKAQAGIEDQFNKHKCKHENASQAIDSEGRR